VLEIVEVLEKALGDPWVLLFLATWAVGYFLKEYTTLNNQKIPWVLLPLGVGLGLALIEVSIGGAIIGCVVALVQLGAYDAIKPMLKGAKK